MLVDSDEEAPPLAVPLSKSITTSDVILTKTDTSVCVPVSRPPVPVTLITGHLGAGKTTLVNYILTAKHGYRCAVLLNEIGDSADIERALVKEPENGEAAPLTDWVELENGCLCCSAKNDMVKALESLLQQRTKFDYILIETTGLANPGPVAAALWTDTELESGICLDAIVTVVDAKNIGRQLADPRPDGAVNEAQQQIAFADIVLLNKIDLVRNDKELIEAEACITSINSEVDIIRCRKCEIETLGLLLNTGLYTSTSVKDCGNTVDPDGHVCPSSDSLSENLCSHGSYYAQPHHHSHSHHSHEVKTVTVLTNEAIDLDILRCWMDELLWEKTEKMDIFRVKGLLNVHGCEEQHILQAVHQLYDIVKGRHWKSDDSRRSKLVFIGRGLKRSVLTNALIKCTKPM